MLREPNDDPAAFHGVEGGGVEGCLSVVLVVLVGLPLLFVPPHPAVGDGWVDCMPAPLTVLGARLDGVPGTSRPPFQFGHTTEDIDVPAGLANSACLRASIVRLAWAVPVIVGLALLPSAASRLLARRRDAVQSPGHTPSSP